MNTYRISLGVWGLFVFFFLGCNQSSDLKDFTSDGCSLFPDQSLISKDDWCDCCFEHDLAYWRGGTEEERELADLKLRDCVLGKTENKVLAEIMYQGVRLGGSPYFYNWYRWGYGWSYQRKYKELSLEEKIMVTQKLEEFFKDSPTGICTSIGISQHVAGGGAAR